MDDWKRRTLLYTWSALMDLKVNEDVFKTTNYDMDVGDAMKKIRLTSTEMSVVVLGNFDVVDGSIDPEFYATGTWYDFWTGDSIVVENVNDPIELKAGEYRLYTDKKLSTPEFVGIDETIVKGAVSDFMVHPNPASSVVYLNMHLRDASDIEVNVYDVQGRNIRNLFSGPLPGGLRSMEADVSGLNEGLYFVVIEAGSQRIVKKLMVN
jgi:hypothetical protein